VPRTLLLTDIPPCSNLTAGIVTAQICRALPLDDLVAYVVLNPGLQPEYYPDLAAIPTKIVDKPSEARNAVVFGRDRGAFGAWVNETRTRLQDIPGLVDGAVAYGRAAKVDQVFAVLQGQTMIRMSRRVASRLDVKLRCLIWDPFDWWLRAWQVDPVNSLLDRRLYENTIRASACVAAPSWAMADHLAAQFGVPSVPVIRAMDDYDILTPTPGFRTPDEFVVGMAGQFYAPKEWTALCAALDSMGWRVGNRQVRLRVYGASPPPNNVPEGRMTFLGWVSPAELTKKLHAECDLLYCPYPMSKDMADVSKFSFPSKLVNYLAAGRPVFFHGPEYSSAYRYVLDNKAGVTCASLDGSDIRPLLQSLEDGRIDYAKMTVHGTSAVARDFSMTVQQKAARKFLGYAA
jgi:hypothetical protein